LVDVKRKISYTIAMAHKQQNFFDESARHAQAALNIAGDILRNHHYFRNLREVTHGVGSLLDFEDR
jgi:hypothetical protein